jgi:hypothetical protein
MERIEVTRMNGPPSSGVPAEFFFTNGQLARSRPFWTNFRTIQDFVLRWVGGPEELHPGRLNL